MMPKLEELKTIFRSKKERGSAAYDFILVQEKDSQKVAIVTWEDGKLYHAISGLTSGKWSTHQMYWYPTTGALLQRVKAEKLGGDKSWQNIVTYMRDTYE